MRFSLINKKKQVPKDEEASKAIAEAKKREEYLKAKKKKVTFNKEEAKKVLKENNLCIKFFSL